MNCKVFIACSLDGYIARSNGSLDWLTGIPNEKNSDYGFSQFLDRIDAIVMGRNTFEAVEGFDEWPYKKKVYVLSNTLKSLSGKYTDKAEIVSGEIKGIIKELSLRGVKDLYVDGGKTIQAFLKDDLIDEMIITTVSRILGNGIPLFGSTGRELEFDCIKTEKLNSEMVMNTYKRRNRATPN